MAPNPKRGSREIEEERDDIISDDVVDTPGSMLADEEDDDDEGPDNAAAKRQQAAESDDGDDDERLAYDDDEDEPTPQGLGRRARRNRASRVQKQLADQRIAALGSEVVTLRQQLEQMSRGQLGLAAGDIDSQMAQLQAQIEAIDAAHAKAVTDGNGAEATRANRLAREAEARLTALAYERRRIEAVAQQRATPAPQAQQRQKAGPHPSAIRYSERFMERNPWFDPDDPSDEDSQIAKAIEDALANEGSRPETKHHWIEFEKRLKARGIGGGKDMRDDDGGDDEGLEQPQRRRALPPRARRGNGGRRGDGAVTLTPFMQEALDAEGLLDTKALTPEQMKYRQRLVKTWRDGLKNASLRANR